MVFAAFFFPSDDTGVARRLVFSAVEIFLGLVKLPLSFPLSFLAGAGGGWEREILSLHRKGSWMSRPRVNASSEERDGQRGVRACGSLLLFSLRCLS